ncbi:MAG TPA: F0F1 ATP synthase subunit B [Phycisphaerae bacterium]|nr:F0F1 ATP synthase subunit B [Phycisphaerae bacterium]
MSIEKREIGMALCVLCATAPAVLASSEGENAEPSLFAGDFGNAFWTLLIFLLLLAVLAKWVWPSVLQGLQRREKFIRDSLTSAKSERQEAQRLLTEYKETLKRAQLEATRIVDEGRRDAEAVKKNILAETKVEGDAMISRARREIELARDDAVRQLHDQTVLLATTIAGKIVRKELTPGDHKKLLDEALADMTKAS